MKVIIRKDIKNLGRMGEIRQVKDGYARNYLIPRGLVELATEKSMKNWKMGEEQRKKRIEKELIKTKENAKKMANITLSFTRKISDGENIFGSVGKNDIVEGLKKSGFDLSKSDVILKEPIKKIGEVKVPLTLHHGIECEIKIKIVPKR